jgi:hypothetical protein
MPRKRTEQLPPPTRYIGMPGLEVRYDRGRRQLKRWLDDGILPPPDLVVNNHPAWKETTLDEADRANTLRAAANGPATQFGRRRKPPIAAE